MKCKESLLEQNKTLVSELNRISKTSNISSNSRKQKKNSDQGSKPRTSSRSKSISLEHNKREYSSQLGHPSPTVETVNEYRGSEISAKQSDLGRKYNSHNLSSIGRESILATEVADQKTDKIGEGCQDLDTSKHLAFETASSVRRTDQLRRIKEENLNTFGKKLSRKAQEEEEAFHFEYSKSKDETIDFNTLERTNKTLSVDGKILRDQLNTDIIILGYHAKLEQISKVRQKNPLLTYRN